MPDARHRRAEAFLSRAMKGKGRCAPGPKRPREGGPEAGDGVARASPDAERSISRKKRAEPVTVGGALLCFEHSIGGEPVERAMGFATTADSHRSVAGRRQLPRFSGLASGL